MALYGTGLYGAGIYGNGTVGDTTTTTQGPEPLVAPVTRPPVFAPQHILGVGPRTPNITWRGAPNHGVKAGTGPARPTIAMPRAINKSFTLRLRDGGEASADFEFIRDKAFILEEFTTDLWWQRRDMNRQATENIGRFNVANVDTSITGDNLLRVSAQFVDYRTLLSARLIMRYLNPGFDPPQTQWLANTTVAEILRWAIPTDMGIDLTAIAVGGPAVALLGTIRKPFELPLGTPIDDTIDNLRRLSNNSVWEWWVDMPSTAVAPKLSFVSRRGSDKGVHLFDIGSGRSPIAAWSMNSASNRYVNNLYFIGKEGGAVVSNPAEIALYGSRDESVTDSSVFSRAPNVTTGPPDVLISFAEQRLAEVSDRTPTYTITLAPGFWRGRDHIDIGDTIKLTIRLGADLLKGSYRVTELTCATDNTGDETVTLTLGIPLVSANSRSHRSAMARFIRYLKNFERKGT